MTEQGTVQFSDTIKVAILSDASQWAIENRQKTDKARKNLMISVFVALFFGITGLTPSKVDAFGIESLPSISIYIFLSILVCYAYLSYRNCWLSYLTSRGMTNRAYQDVIGYNYIGAVVEEVSMRKSVTYSLTWNIYMPVAVSIATIIICLTRALFEYSHGAAHP